MNNTNVNINKNNTKKELLNIISKLKKTQIVDMIDNYNKINEINNNEEFDKSVNKNISLKIEKKKIKLPSQQELNKLKLNNRKLNNNAYNNN